MKYMILFYFFGWHAVIFVVLFIAVTTASPQRRLCAKLEADAEFEAPSTASVLACSSLELPLVLGEESWQECSNACRCHNQLPLLVGQTGRRRKARLQKEVLINVVEEKPDFAPKRCILFDKRCNYKLLNIIRSWSWRRWLSERWPSALRTGRLCGAASRFAPPGMRNDRISIINWTFDELFFRCWKWILKN